MKNEWAENRLADFNLWANGIGALALGRASLDSRLALWPELQDAVINLLRLLELVTEDCIGQGDQFDNTFLACV